MVLSSRKHSLTSIIMMLTISLLLASGKVLAAPKAKVIAYWNKSNEQSSTTINHSAWQKILTKYVNTHQSGINRVDYAALKEQGLTQLKNYLEYLGDQTPTTLNKPEQKAFWLNLFNAGLVYIVAANYPIESISNIKPWKMKFITVENQILTLDNIEHGILRAIYMDNRVHYGFACASISCPSLSRSAFTGNNVDKLLRQLATEFINHPRGVKIERSTLYLNRIYDWYIADFGGTEEALLEYIKFFAKPELKQKLGQKFKNIEYYKHDWTLNKL